MSKIPLILDNQDKAVFFNGLKSVSGKTFTIFQPLIYLN